MGYDNPIHDFSDAHDTEPLIHAAESTPERNFVVLAPEGHRPIKMWTKGVEVEDAARRQLLNVSSLSFIYKHMAVMPDVHWGMGATVGSVIPTKGAVIPAAVGVDIGCGMVAARLNLKADQLPDNLAALREAIEKAVPHGRANNGGPGDRGAWGETPETVLLTWLNLSRDYEALAEKYPKLGHGNDLNHLGTMGTGNHFLEICLDEADNVWLMLHSGSRGVGNRIGQFFINLAKEDMRRWFINLPDQDLAYLPEGTEHFEDYWRAVDWAQRYARANRNLMFGHAITALRAFLPPFSISSEIVNCHHNYVTRERHFGDNVIVTRKGAISAKEGEWGIIPGSMGTRSYIVQGKGNRESFMSASHGAGRRMSRGEAKKTFTVEDLVIQTAGVECRKDAGVLDEAPGAYKPIDAVIEAEKDLVEVRHTLKAVLCIKG